MKKNFSDVLDFLEFTKYESSKSWTKIYNKFQLTAKINSLGNFEFIYPEGVKLGGELIKKEN